MVCRSVPAVVRLERGSPGVIAPAKPGPRVFVEFRASRVRDRDGQVLSVPSVLSGAGYRVRARAEFITRDGLENARVLIVDRSLDALGWRTTTLVRRWTEQGGAVLILAPAQPGPTRTRHGAGRIATLDPGVLTPRDFVIDLLDTMRWLEPSAVGVAEVRLPR